MPSSPSCWPVPGWELLPFGSSVRKLVTGAGGPARAPQVAETLVNRWFDTVLPAAAAVMRWW
jgi:hypothetical protein